MTELKIIKQQEVLGKEFTVYGTFEEPLILAKDVAEWIEHSKVSMMLLSIDSDEKTKGTILTSGQRREVWFLTEEGLYEVLMQSRKPIAKALKKEVKKILKEVRKRGIYATDTFIDKVLEDPDAMIKLVQQVKEERDIKVKQQELKNNTTTEDI